MAHSRVPAELVYLIIEYLAVDNQKFLTDIGSCSLVCKSWLPLCRSYLFKLVKLEPPREAAQKTAFLASIIKVQPYIADFVREIQFACHPSNDAFGLPEETSTDGPLSILLKLPRVHSLWIYKDMEPISFDDPVYYPGTSYFGWRSILDKYLSTNQLTTITLTGIHDVPIIPILSSSQLTTLNISYCQIADISPSVPALVTQRPRFSVKSLTLVMVEKFCFQLLALCHSLETMHLWATYRSQINSDLDILPVPTFSCLTSLTMANVSEWGFASKMAPYEMAFPAVILANIQVKDTLVPYPRFSTLQSLEFTEFYDQDGPFDWSDAVWHVNDSLPHLTHIKFEISGKVRAEGVFEGLQELLSDIKGRNVVRTFAFTVNETIEYDVEEWWEANFGSWRRLGNTLGENPEDFPFLEKVTFTAGIRCFDQICFRLLSDVGTEKGYSDAVNFLSEPLREFMLARTDIQVDCEVNVTY